MELSNFMIIFVPTDCCILANSTDPDKMPPYAAFYLGLHCSPKYLFIGTENEKH